jgi:hypothetical protein
MMKDDGAFLICYFENDFQLDRFNSWIPAPLKDCKAATTSASGESAVDNQSVSGHKRRLTRAQPQNCRSHFFDATDATDGMQGGKVILLRIHAIGEAIDHFSVDRGRIDGVNANA